MSESIKDTLARLSAFVSQNFTDVETGPGSVISELLLKLEASVQNEQYNLINSLSQGSAIASALTATADTNSVMMDMVASNYNVSRSTGTKVKGKIKVTISEPNEYNLRRGLTFVQPGLNLSYTLSSDTRVSPKPSTRLSEVQLYENQGLYYFLLDVEAADVGPEYQLSSGSVFSLGSTNFLIDFVSAEAYGNFTSGKAVETDKELITKIQTSLGNSRLTSAAGIANRLRNEFAGFQALSVCGANDPEMVRSKRNALGISTFGKADVYVRTSLGPELIKITKSAVRRENNVWVMQMLASDVPGFYRIASILPNIVNVNLTGSLVFDVTYGKTTYPDRNNEIFSVSDARFTKYQTATVSFTYDGDKTTLIDSSASFIVEVAYQPNILEIQDLLLSDSERLACADYLVKAVTPCMVSLNIGLVKKRPTDTADNLGLQNLKKDIFTYVNTIPFGGELHASNIIKLCHNYDIKRVDLPISMTGTILYVNSDGSTGTKYLEDSDVLTIPTDLTKGISPKNTAYFIDYYSVKAGNTNPVDNIGLSIV
jgi:hypothetical protein